MSKAAKAGAPRAWQRMLSGRRLDLLDPSPLDVELEDIAHGLARVARWNGQTKGAHIFSVAQHVLLVEALARQKSPTLDARGRLAVLLHDSAEYVIGDMISPFKSALGAGYKDFEARLEAAIHVRFQLPPKTPQTIKTLIKKADKACAFFEATQLAGFTEKESLGFFGSPPAGYSLVIEPQPAPVAQARYLERYRVLAGAVGLIPADDAWHTE